MAKAVHNDVLDAALNEIATATSISVCSQEPTTRTEAVTTYMLITHTLTGGDFTNADGDVSGRKVTIAQQASLTVTNTGTGNHIALTDGSTLLYVTTCPAVSLTAAATETINAFDIELRDPT